MPSVAAELSFVPLQSPYEITSKKEGNILISRLQKQFSVLHKYGLLMKAKLDPQHDVGTENETYCVEIVPFYHWETYWFESKNDWKILHQGFNELFRIMKNNGLAPIVETRHGKTIKEWPGGGCHLHLGHEFFSSNPNWYSRAELFHRNLAVDYANRPYIRWLFKQWFADCTALAPLTLDNFKKGITEDEVYCNSFTDASIEPRFMSTSKTLYPTFEFRMFSMVADPLELRSIIRFVTKWTTKIFIDTLLQIQDQKLRYKITLNPRKLRQMGRICDARKICQDFLDSLDLKWDNYASFFERNYRRRIKYGKMI